MLISDLKLKLNVCNDMGDILNLTLTYLNQHNAEFFAAITYGMEGLEWSVRFPYGLITHPWTNHYVNRQFNRKDASIRLALSLENEYEPLLWSQARAVASNDEKIVFEEAENFALKEGLVVSLRIPNGSICLFSVAGFNFAPNEEQIAILSRAFGFIHKRAMQLMKQDEGLNVADLTDRQNEVMKYLIEGKSTSVIAEFLNISEDTVKDHKKRIYQILNVGDVNLAIFRAYQAAAYNPPTR